MDYKMPSSRCFVKKTWFIVQSQHILSWYGTIIHTELSAVQMLMWWISNLGIKLIKLLNEHNQRKSPPQCFSRQQDFRSEGAPTHQPGPAGGGLTSTAPPVCLISGEENLIPPSLPSLHAWTTALTVPWAAEYVITLFGLAALIETVRVLKSSRQPDCEGKDRHHRGTIWKIPCLGLWSCIVYSVIQ